MSRIDYQNTFYNPVVKENTKGFLTSDEIKKLKEDTYTAIIPIGMQYRPDLIAQYFLGEATKYWVISCVNNFTNGIMDYKEGRKIKIPNF